MNIRYLPNSRVMSDPQGCIAIHAGETEDRSTVFIRRFLSRQDRESFALQMIRCAQAMLLDEMFKED